MPGRNRVVKASDFKCWWIQLRELLLNPPTSSTDGERNLVAGLFHQANQAGIRNDAVSFRLVEMRGEPTSVQAEYSLRNDFDWANGEIVIGSAEWAEFTGPDGFITSVVKVTGIPETNN